MSKHSDWIDHSNYGVSHFGLRPSIFPLSNIRFDVFHLICAITRKLMSYIHKYLRNYNLTLNKRFYEILSEHWNNYYVNVWAQNKGFQCFTGKEIKAFIEMKEDIVNFMNDNFHQRSQIASDICNMVTKWNGIVHFLTKVIIIGKDATEDEQVTSRLEYEQEKIMMEM